MRPATLTSMMCRSSIQAVIRPAATFRRKRVPAAFFEIEIGAGFVVGGVPAVDAGEADDVAAPAAGDPGAERVAHGEGQAGEEIIAVEARGFEADFVVGFGEGAGPGDAGHGRAGAEDDVAVFDADGAVAGEGGFAPAAERLAVEEREPSRGLGLWAGMAAHASSAAEP